MMQRQAAIVVIVFAAAFGVAYFVPSLFNNLPLFVKAWNKGVADFINS